MNCGREVYGTLSPPVKRFSGSHPIGHHRFIETYPTAYLPSAGTHSALADTLVSQCEAEQARWDKMARIPAGFWDRRKRGTHEYRENESLLWISIPQRNPSGPVISLFLNVRVQQ